MSSRPSAGLPGVTPAIPPLPPEDPALGVGVGVGAGGEEAGGGRGLLDPLDVAGATPEETGATAAECAVGDCPVPPTHPATPQTKATVTPTRREPMNHPPRSRGGQAEVPDPSWTCKTPGGLPPAGLRREAAAGPAMAAALGELRLLGFDASSGTTCPTPGTQACPALRASLS